VDGMANVSELSLNVVMNNRPKNAERPKPNGDAAGAGAVVSPTMGQGLRIHAAGEQREPKPNPVIRAERGKPDALPVRGQPSVSEAYGAAGNVRWRKRTPSGNRADTGLCPARKRADFHPVFHHKRAWQNG
jgi:hypothetical protein